MKLKEALLTISDLVSETEIISHNAIRKICTETAIDEVANAQGIDDDDVGIDIIGSDELSEKIKEIAENPEKFLDVDIVDLSLTLRSLDSVFRGDNIFDYVNDWEENELEHLEFLIYEAKKFVELFF
jgi:hypothetical protein